MLTKDEIDALVSENSYYGGCINVEAFAAAVIAAHERKVLEDVEPVGWMGVSGVGERIVSKTQMYPFMTTSLYPAHTVAALKSRADALAARVAELAAALLKCRDMVEHPDNVAFIDAALAAKGQA